MKIYRCPNNCTVSNQYKRCPSCGEWLLYDGQDEEEAERKTEEISKYNAQRYGKWNNK